MRRRPLLATLAAATLTASPVHAADTPVQIVEKIYRISAGADGKWNGPSAFLKPDFRKSTFSKGLAQAVRAADAKNRKGEIGWLDFDPISNSQDPTVIGLKIAATAAAADKSTVRASFRTGPGTPLANVDYDFVLEGADWKLDDIRTPGADGWSIRRMTRAATGGKN